MSPDELVHFLRNRQTIPEVEGDADLTSETKLADVAAKVVLASLHEYESQLASIALLRPIFAHAILEALREDVERAIPWPQAIGLCEELMSDNTARMDTSYDFDSGWPDVRSAIVRLLEMGLRNPERAIPVELLDRVRSILLILVDDPDPDPSSEPPPGEWSQLRDPATVALNHVRPSALRALIDYAGYRARSTGKRGQDDEPQPPGP
jgi:hypothetical protein